MIYINQASNLLLDTTHLPNEHVKSSFIKFINHEVEKGTEKQILSNYHSTCSKRYHFYDGNPREQLATAIFDTCYQTDPKGMLHASTTDRKPNIQYPLWRRVCILTPATIASGFFNSRLIKIATSICFISITIFCMSHIYMRSQILIAQRVVPFVINNAPLATIRAFNTVCNVVNFITKNPLEVIASLFIAKAIILRIGTIPYVTAIARNLTFDRIVNFVIPTSFYEFAFIKVKEVASIGTKACEEIGSVFEHIAKEEQNKVESAKKDFALRVWKEVILTEG